MTGRASRLIHGGCLECGESVARIYGEHHPLLTVVGLPTVNPYGFCVYDVELSGGEGSHIVVCDWHTTNYDS